MINKKGDFVKRIICIALCLTFIFPLSACFNKGTSNDDMFETESTGTVSEQDTTVLPALPIAYDGIINHIVNAYPWNDDEFNMVPENPELSYMYRRNASLSEIGFALIDLDGNGQEELLISDINSPFVYDLYTISNGQAIHIFASHERNAFYLYENGYVENQWSGGAALSGHDFYKLNEGQLDFIERITLDADHALDAGMIADLSEANEENSFFRSESDQPKDYKWVSSDDAIKAIDAYQNANKQIEIAFTLLSEYKK